MNCALDDVKDEEGISDHRYSHYKKLKMSVELREENEDVRFSKIGTEESSCRAQSKAVEDGALFWWVSCPEHGRENLCKDLRRDPQPPRARVCEGIQAMCCEVWGNLARLDNHWRGGAGTNRWCLQEEEVCGVFTGSRLEDANVLFLILPRFPLQSLLLTKPQRNTQAEMWVSGWNHKTVSRRVESCHAWYLTCYICTILLAWSSPAPFI